MTTHATIKPSVAVEKIARTASSEYPFRVHSYQFKTLDDARRFSRELLAIPKSCRDAKVEMFHRSVEIRRTVTDDKGKVASTVSTVLLDVTTDSPEEAEAKWRQ